MSERKHELRSRIEKWRIGVEPHFPILRQQELRETSDEHDEDVIMVKSETLDTADQQELLRQFGNMADQQKQKFVPIVERIKSSPHSSVRGSDSSDHGVQVNVAPEQNEENRLNTGSQQGTHGDRGSKQQSNRDRSGVSGDDVRPQTPDIIVKQEIDDEDAESNHNSINMVMEMGSSDGHIPKEEIVDEEDDHEVEMEQAGRSDHESSDGRDIGVDHQTDSRIQASESNSNHGSSDGRLKLGEHQIDNQISAGNKQIGSGDSNPGSSDHRLNMDEHQTDSQLTEKEAPGSVSNHGSGDDQNMDDHPTDNQETGMGQTNKHQEQFEDEVEKAESEPIRSTRSRNAKITNKATLANIERYVKSAKGQKKQTKATADRKTSSRLASKHDKSNVIAEKADLSPSERLYIEEPMDKGDSYQNKQPEDQVEIASPNIDDVGGDEDDWQLSDDDASDQEDSNYAPTDSGSDSDDSISSKSEVAIDSTKKTKTNQLQVQVKSSHKPPSESSVASGSSQSNPSLKPQSTGNMLLDPIPEVERMVPGSDFESVQLPPEFLEILESFPADYKPQSLVTSPQPAADGVSQSRNCGFC